MTNQSFVNAYNKGKSLQGTDINTIIYSNLAPEIYFLDFTLNFFFECGYQGYDFPEYVKGWRYGDIPESGQSYNFRDQLPEHGVSVMEIYGIENNDVDKVSMMFIASQNRPVTKIEGYLNPYKFGSDGEYLLVSAKEAE